MYSVQRGKDHAKTATFFRKELDGKLDKIKEVAIHNEAMVEEYKKGQEGVEYVHANPEADPRYITERKLKRMFKSQLDSMKYDEKKFKDPNSRAAEFERNRNRILNIKINKDEVKNYPGSEKGRKPEDDKDFYATWFMSNRPESLKAVEEEVIIPIIEANRRKVRLDSYLHRFQRADVTKKAKNEHTSQTSFTTSSMLHFFVESKGERVCSCCVVDSFAAL